MSVVGLNFIDYVVSSNSAFFVVRLKPYEERTDRSQSADAIINALRPKLAAIQGAIAFPFNLPPILGLGSTGGFQYALQALQGQSPNDLAAVTRALTVAANQRPELAGVFTTFAADTPQVYLDIDRDKAQVLGVRVSDIFTALQASLGGYYVNDFNLFGRTWQVNIESEDRFRDTVDDIYRVYVRNSAGAMVPVRSLGHRQARARAAGRHPLQRLPRRHHQRCAQARLQLGPGAGRHGAARQDDAAAPATASNGPARRCRRSWRPARPASCWGWPSCSRTFSWWRCTRAGTSRCPCCFRSRSACWAPSPSCGGWGIAFDV